MTSTPDHIPAGARSIRFVVEPIPPVLGDGLNAWQRSIVSEMEAEGLIITTIDGTSFSGYYFPHKIRPRRWLKDVPQ